MTIYNPINTNSNHVLKLHVFSTSLASCFLKKHSSSLHLLHLAHLYAWKVYLACYKIFILFIYVYLTHITICILNNNCSEHRTDMHLYFSTIYISEKSAHRIRRKTQRCVECAGGVRINFNYISVRMPKQHSKSNNKPKRESIYIYVMYECERGKQLKYMSLRPAGVVGKCDRGFVCSPKIETDSFWVSKFKWRTCELMNR